VSISWTEIKATVISPGAVQKYATNGLEYKLSASGFKGWDKGFMTPELGLKFQERPSDASGILLAAGTPPAGEVAMLLKSPTPAVGSLRFWASLK